MGMTTYGYIRKPLYEGSLATTGEEVFIGGTTIAGEKYPFGRAVTWNGNGRQIRPLESANDRVIGVLPRLPYYEDYLDADNEPGYSPDNYQVKVLEKGRIAVLVEVDINHGDPVYVRHTVSGLKVKIGVFRNDDDTDTALLVPNGVWFPAYENVAGGIIAKANTVAILQLN